MKIGFLICMPLLFGYVTTLNECGKCKCCKGGASKCQAHNSVKNKCLDGCTSGYFGDRCTHACMDNCQTCSLVATCLKCLDGYFGSYNCEKCPHRCLTCSSLNVCESCKDGFYSGKIFDDCRHICKENCTSCTSYNTCTKCKAGFYNSEHTTEQNDCRHPCRGECTSCSSYDNCTECINGKFNGVYSNCSESCNSDCKVCTLFDNCTKCVDGKYNDVYSNCSESCISDCKACTSYDTCTECVDGKFNDVHSNCSEYCSSDCTSCVSYDNCLACNSGKYGTSCQRDCGIGCENHTCDFYSGNCTCLQNFQGYTCDRCVHGKYGPNCNITCPVGCLNNLCDINGTCLSCKEGFTGGKCEECIPGTFGTDCNFTCPMGCLNMSCHINGTCPSCNTGFTGDICEECIPDRYGKDCNIPCPEGCSSDSCDINGTCLSCKSGFKGTKCNKCVPGQYGPDCNITCPLNCENGVCKNDGECDTCRAGFTGNRCDMCRDDKYGNNCDKQCSTKCKNKSCNRNGDCYSCISGYSGNNCSQLDNAKPHTGGNMGVIIGAAAGGGVFILIIIVVIIAVMLIRKRKRSSEPEENDMTEIVKKTDETGLNYCQDMKSGIPDGTQDGDALYAVPNKVKTYVNKTKSSDDNASSKSVDNPNYEETPIQKDVIIANETDHKDPDETRDVDVVYAVPNKVKKDVDKTKSSDDNASPKTVSNPNYEESLPKKDIIVMDKRNDKEQSDFTLESNMKNNSVGNAVAEITFSPKDLGRSDTCNTEDEEEIDLMAITNNHETLAAFEVADTYYNVAAVKRRRIEIKQLQNFVSKKTNDDFADEFEQLPRGLIKPCADSQRRENLAKNRYKGIYPYDGTRVVLKDCSSDYINASYIDGYNKRKAYIASIGPTFKYMGDMSAFWIMVWQEKVGKIVMLTKLDEGGAPKCDQYWPEKGFSLLYANIQVTSQTEDFYADYIVRSFTVQKDSEKRTIFQVHFIAWPDKGTPDDTTSLIDFCQRVNNIKTLLEGPILVHCSAGIGRTGTYIGLDSLTEEGEAEGEVDIYAFVRNMREQRVNMVQTAEQYQFLHNALVHTFDSKTVDVSKFAEYMKLLTDDHLAKEFQKLQTSVEQRPDDETEAVKRNLAMKNKNRIGADIPGDRYRPKLNLGKNPGSSEFINAVYVNSYKTVNRYLVAQTPLPDTVVDFLTLLVQEKVSCIVSMEKGAADDETVGSYFYEHKQVKIGRFTIKSQQRTDAGHYTLQTLNISQEGKYGPEEITIPHIQYTHWNDSENIPEGPQNFMEFVKDVELKYGGIEAKGPLLVHCRNGAEKSGIFCVVSILLEKVRIDKKISFVNTMRQIKLRRQKAIPNKDQFIFCHKCVNEYIRSFDSCTKFGKKA